MEKKVKIELPKKYTIGIEVVMPVCGREALSVCKRFMATVSEFIGNTGCPMDFDHVLRHGGKIKVSNPLIQSIAEIKAEGLNDAFNHYNIPFKAFLEMED